LMRHLRKSGRCFCVGLQSRKRDEQSIAWKCFPLKIHPPLYPLHVIPRL
jgi:hypothetical protein